MVAGMPQEERAQIDAVQRRLTQKYTELPHDHVAAVVQQVHARFNQSTVRDYIPLLVERRAREELSKSNGGPGGGLRRLGRAVAGSETVGVRQKFFKWWWQRIREEVGAGEKVSRGRAVDT
jgi:hypothetical protein